MALKIPPPILFLFTALLMKLMPNMEIFQCHIDIGVIILLTIIGVIIDVFSLFAFFKQKTTASPFTPQNSSALITTGIYQITRNPMYLSLALYLGAWGIWLGNLLSLSGIVLFCGYITYFQIIPEEYYLEKIFGDEYRIYKQKVRRWL
ncbi:Putative protein-S-isoprenylcysteine methyltransferase [Phocoenobacter uteri]|uniref:Isoprenylcysteine carboxylmethyltransferase family protein n=1 Tax=Phocoenobacter uteri TaxID=146806 RepID=A0A379CCK6_9PAST|nr:isoprenylcysteine carboxylmethyltransferase family protein [Phocoenobacter uteri]MDG6881436.1 hypothetical protein [Phocoenobacter uteri]SUB59465.1 Putative protein-S-isoprenylcysteine methyltransferase [Phocoenobacter uteri]